jgi:AraC-like DNA-binding protein
LRDRRLRDHNRDMPGRAARHHRLAPSAATASAVAAIFIDERDHDAALVAIPRPEIHLAVRFGPSAHRGLDVHAFGGQPRVRRKLIRAGQRTVMARLHLGAAEAVLGVPASALAGRIVALEDLWGADTTRRLCDRLAAAHDTRAAAVTLERAIGERLAAAQDRRGRAQLALDAAHRLATAHVHAVADDLGVSERHLRRVFRDTVGVSPKAFARLMRFHRALSAACQDGPARWARIAAAAGYYDQAHLIAEFRAIAGVTPRALIGELGDAPR